LKGAAALPKAETPEVVQRLLRLGGYLSQFANSLLRLLKWPSECIPLFFNNRQELPGQAMQRTSGSIANKLLTRLLYQPFQSVYELSPIPLGSSLLDLFECTDLEYESDGTLEPPFENLSGEPDRSGPLGLGDAIRLVQHEQDD
jgi:hypothetical protein